MDQNKTSPQEGAAKSPEGLISFGDLMKKSWDNYKKAIGTYTGLVFTPLLGFIPVIIIMIIWAVSLYGLGNDSSGAISTGLSWFLGIATIVAVIFMYIIALKVYIAIILKVNNPDLTYKQLMKQTKGKVLSFLFAGILVSLVMVTGYMFLIIPGFILSIFLIFVSIVNIYEGKKGISALVRSKDLVKGYWWPILGRLLLLMLIFCGGLMIVALVTFGIGAIVVEVFLIAFMNIFVVEMYNDLKLKKVKESDVPEKGRTLFIVFAILGLIMFPLYVWGMFSISSSLENTATQWEYSTDDTTLDEMNFDDFENWDVNVDDSTYTIEDSTIQTE